MGTYRLSHKIMKEQQKCNQRKFNHSTVSTTMSTTIGQQLNNHLHKPPSSSSSHLRNSPRTASAPACRQQRVSLATTTVRSPLTTTDVTTGSSSSRRSDGAMMIGATTAERLKYASMNRQDSMLSSKCSRIDSIDFDDIDELPSSIDQSTTTAAQQPPPPTAALETMAAAEASSVTAYRNGPTLSSIHDRRNITIERECHSLADLEDDTDRVCDNIDYSI